MIPSVRADNKFHFLCPTVNRVEPFLACVLRRFHVWRAERIAEQDCVVCMKANKCPAVHMINKENKEQRAFYFSQDATPKKLPADILERIANVVIVPYFGINTEITPQRLSELCGVKVESVPTGLSAPLGAIPEAKIHKTRKSATEAPEASDSALDYVRTEMADHINAVMDN